MTYMGIAVIIGIILAIVGTVLLYVLIMPEKKKDRLNGFFKVVRSIFNFDALLLEKILKVLYAFSTLACIIVGFLMLFSFERYSSYYYSYSYTTWYGWIGLLIMILGPILMRIIYEYTLMLIFATSRLISIDKKIPAGCGKGAENNGNGPDAPATSAPVYERAPEAAPYAAPVFDQQPYAAPEAEPAFDAEPQAPVQEPVYRFCAQCGTKYDITQGGCPNCGK